MTAGVVCEGAIEWSVWTTTVRVVTADSAATSAAGRLVAEVLAEVDRAANRFHADSELSRLNDKAGRGPRAVGPVLWSLLNAAANAAAATEGLVDPTIASSLNDLGYDRTITLVPTISGAPVPVRVRRPVGWKRIVLDEHERTVDLPRGCQLDLGATAKAWAADRAADVAAGSTGTGVLVSLGGDIALAGPAPERGWLVAISDDHRCRVDDDPVIVIRSGGLATSSTTTRQWRRGGQQLHHIVDPRTARPADDYWRTISVAAATCVDANTAATAAVVLGRAARGWLIESGLPARLVGRTGSVSCVGDWPRVAA